MGFIYLLTPAKYLTVTNTTMNVSSELWELQIPAFQCATVFTPMSATHSSLAWNQVSVLKVDSDISWHITLAGVEMFIFSGFIPNCFLESNQLSQTRVPRVTPMFLGHWWLYSARSDTRQRYCFLQLRPPGRDSCPYRHRQDRRKDPQFEMDWLS